MSNILFLAWIFLFFGTSQEFLNKPAWSSDSAPGAIADASQDKDSNDLSVLQINRTPTCSRPSGFIHDNFTWPALVLNSHITGHCSYRTQWNSIVERKPCESYWRPVRLNRAVKNCRHNCTTFELARTFTSSKINLFASSTVFRGETEEINLESWRIKAPTSLWEIQSCEWTRSGTLRIFHLTENMIRCQKRSIISYDETASLDRFYFCGSPTRFNFGADNRNDRELDSFDRRDKRSLCADSATADQKKAEDNDILHLLLTGTIQNDGSFTGNCIVENRRDARYYKCAD